MQLKGKQYFFVYYFLFVLLFCPFCIQSNKINNSYFNFDLFYSIWYAFLLRCKFFHVQSCSQTSNDLTAACLCSELM